MKTINLDYREAAVLGGMPRTSSELTLSEYMYAVGFTAPRHPVPAIYDPQVCNPFVLVLRSN